MRLARLEIGPYSVRLIVTDSIRRERLTATVEDALRTIGDECGGVVSTEGEVRRIWIGRASGWVYRCTLEQPVNHALLAAELRRRGFRVIVGQSTQGMIGA